MSRKFVNELLTQDTSSLRRLYRVTQAKLGEAIDLPEGLTIFRFFRVAEPSIESYIFDFDGDLYGDVLRVRFLHRIRDERKFSGIDELKAQIEKDTRRARNYFGHRGVRNMLEIL